MTTRLKGKLTRLVLIGLTAVALSGGHAAMTPDKAEAAMMVKWTCEYYGGNTLTCKKEYFMV